MEMVGTQIFCTRSDRLRDTSTGALRLVRSHSGPPDLGEKQRLVAVAAESSRRPTATR